MYAVIETGGKQYKVAEGDVLYLEKISLEASETVVFDKVLLFANDADVKVGAPYVDGVKVEGTLEKHGKAKKIHIFKIKAKKNYRRRIGHRQAYSKVVITAIKF